MKKLVAIILGSFIGNIVFFLLAMLANTINKTPPELMDPKTPEAVALRVSSTTTYTWITTLAGLSIGCFVAGLFAAFFLKKYSLATSMIIGVLFLPWAFYTFYIVYPEVLWVPLLMTFVVFIFPVLGGKLYKNLK